MLLCVCFGNVVMDLSQGGSAVATAPEHYRNTAMLGFTSTFRIPSKFSTSIHTPCSFWHSAFRVANAGPQNVFSGSARRTLHSIASETSCSLSPHSAPAGIPTQYIVDGANLGLTLEASDDGTTMQKMIMKPSKGKPPLDVLPGTVLLASSLSTQRAANLDSSTATGPEEIQDVLFVFDGKHQHGEYQALQLRARCAMSGADVACTAARESGSATGQSGWSFLS